MNKELVTIFLALAMVCATVPMAAQKEPIPVALPDNVAAMLPALCPKLRLTLPEQRRTPWSQRICLERFAKKGMEIFHVELETRAADSEMKQRIRAAGAPFREAPPLPMPTPTPTTTPTTTPTATPTPAP